MILAKKHIFIISIYWLVQPFSFETTMAQTNAKYIDQQKLLGQDGVHLNDKVNEIDGNIVPEKLEKIVNKQKTIKNFVLSYGNKWTDEDLQFAARHYDLIITSASNTTKHWIDVLRAANPNIIILWYHEAFSAREEQPEFWLRQNHGTPLLAYRNSPGRHIADPGNENWRNFKAKHCSTDVELVGCDGIFLDNVMPAHRWGAAFSYTQPDKYPTQQAWEGTMQGLINRVRTALREKMFLVNSWNYWVKNVDGYMREGICSPEIDHDRWLNELNTLCQAVADSQITIPIMDSGDSSDSSILFALGTYLLYRGPKSYFYVPAYRDGRASYGAPAPWNNLQRIDIGQPVGEYFRDSNVYKRRYEEAIVVVNPWHEPQSANLKESYLSITGEQISEDFVLKPRTAEILVIR